MINYNITLSKIVLNNDFIEFQGKYYKQKNGIITEDSFTIANIALHFTWFPLNFQKQILCWKIKALCWLKFKNQMLS